MRRGIEPRVAAVAVVVEIAVVAGGAAVAPELGQDVLGGAALASRQHPGVGLVGEAEARLQPLARGVPAGVAGIDRRQAAPDRGRHRRPGRGEERRQPRRPGERREQRIGGELSEAGEAVGGGGLDQRERGLGLALQHRQRRAVGIDRPHPRMPRHQRVERGGRRGEVALGDAGQRGAGLLGDGGHGEERRRGGRIDRPGHFRLRPRRRRLARRGGAGDKARDKAGDEAGGEDQREDRRAAGPAAGARGRAGRGHPEVSPAAHARCPRGPARLRRGRQA